MIGTLFVIHNERPEVTSCPKMLSPVQTDATLLANNSQHCWMLHVATSVFMVFRCLFVCLFCHLEILGLNNSVIVGNNSEYLANLTNWIKPRRNVSDWKLCWRASRDGWSSSRFHSLCDEKGPTVTIVKVGKYIFGGYTNLPWSIRKYHSLL